MTTSDLLLTLAIVIGIVAVTLAARILLKHRKDKS